MTRIGILGYGFAGRGFHAYLVGQEPRFQLAAVASRDADRRVLAEADHGVRTFESLDQMLESGAVDLVIVATPHDARVTAEMSGTVGEIRLRTVPEIGRRTTETSRMLSKGPHH